MMKNILKSICWFVLYFVLQIVGMVVLFFVDLTSGNLNFSNLEDMELFFEELMQYMYHIAMPSIIVASGLFFVVFIVYKLIRKHSFDCKTIEPNKFLFMICLGILLNVIVTVLINLVAMIVPTEVVESMNNATSAALEGHLFWVLLLGTGIMAPILEELTFRYGICGTISRSNVIVGIVLSSIVFGIVHGNILQSSYALVLGLIFGYIYMKYNNIWYSIALHVAINSSSVLVSYFESVWLYVILGILAIIGLVFLLIKHPELKDILPKKKKMKLES